jgi:hypothetical protein
MRASLSVIAVVVFACAARAQPVPPDPDALPGGREVSQPLTPVGPEPGAPKVDAPAKLPEPPAPPKPDAPKLEAPKDEPKEIPPERPIGPLGPAWHDLSLLYWWPMRQPIPPLAVGGANNRVLLGGRAIDSEPSAGGRFTFGTALNQKHTVGYEISYFFLGTRAFWDAVRGGPGTGIGTLGVPFVNADTGAPEVLVLARPDGPSATLAVSSAVRVQGWEVNALSNLYAGTHLKLNAILGWRYFQFHEGVGVHTTQIFGAADPQLARVSEQFDAHNRFHGGQIGLHADARRGNVFCELTGKVAFGQNYEVVRSEGMTILYGASGTRSFGGTGNFVQPGTFGRSANGTFAVLPEGTIKLGVRLGDSGRLYVGYSFLYLSDAVRPGDQIDRTAQFAQLAVVGAPVPVDRVPRAIQRSDVWVQGVVVGFEARF